MSAGHDFARGSGASVPAPSAPCTSNCVPAASRVGVLLSFQRLPTPPGWRPLLHLPLTSNITPPFKEPESALTSPVRTPCPSALPSAAVGVSPHSLLARFSPQTLTFLGVSSAAGPAPPTHHPRPAPAVPTMPPHHRCPTPGRVLLAHCLPSGRGMKGHKQA